MLYRKLKCGFRKLNCGIDWLMNRILNFFLCLYQFCSSSHLHNGCNQCSLRYQSLKQAFDDGKFTHLEYLTYKYRKQKRELSNRTRYILFSSSIIISSALLAVSISFVMRNGAAPCIPDLLTIHPYDANQFQTLWQAHATIITLTFIVVIFLWEITADEVTQNTVIRLIMHEAGGMQTLVFSLTATGFIGYMTLTASGEPNKVLRQDVAYFLLILALFTLYLISKLYLNVADILFAGKMNEYVVDDSKSKIDEIVNGDMMSNISKSILREQVPEYNTTWLGGQMGASGEEFSIETASSPAYITDIDLTGLNDLISGIEEQECVDDEIDDAESDVASEDKNDNMSEEDDVDSTDTEVLYGPSLGDRLTESDSVVLVVSGEIEDDKQTVERQLENAIQTSESPPW